jgi:signal transduction histidine kinase
VEIESLGRNLDHVKNIVAMQQNYAKVCGVREPVNIADVASDALNMNSEAFRRHNVRVTLQFKPVPRVVVDKHKVMQIMINLLRNAKYAASHSASDDKQINVGIDRNGNGCVKIVVQDNGVGIAPENLERIFAHGFTTKTDGHGFGLHSCAVAAQEMGGSLRAQSDGPGKGATFILELPMEGVATKI